MRRHLETARVAHETARAPGRKTLLQHTLYLLLILPYSVRVLCGGGAKANLRGFLVVCFVPLAPVFQLTTQPAVPKPEATVRLPKVQAEHISQC